MFLVRVARMYRNFFESYLYFIGTDCHNVTAYAAPLFNYELTMIPKNTVE